MSERSTSAVSVSASVVVAVSAAVLSVALLSVVSAPVVDDVVEPLHPTNEQVSAETRTSDNTFLNFMFFLLLCYIKYCPSYFFAVP